MYFYFFFFFQAEDGIRDLYVTGVQTCALPILLALLALGALALSAAPARWAETRILKGERAPVLIGLAATLALSVGYFMLQIVDLATAGFSHQTNAYGSAFFGVMALQLVFVFAGMILCANVQL